MNLDELQKKCDALFDAKHDKALNEIERLQSKLATRDALIERLVEAGEVLADELPYGANEEIVDTFDALCDEWQAMKGGE